MAYIYDIADTWAASGTVFTGIKLSVTDTASAAGSLLMDLQVGGVSFFSSTKAGVVLAPNSFRASTLYMYSTAAAVRADTTANRNISLDPIGVTVSSSGVFQFGSGNDAAGSRDLILARDAANTLAQRNGVNAQAFNLYNTYTDASNYERVEFKWLFNIATLESVAAGTGTRRVLRLKSGGGSLDITNFTANANLNLEMGGNFITGPSYIQFAEQTAPAAPAADRVRIYAEDDGAGKTRLMARFATGAAVQIAIEP